MIASTSPEPPNDVKSWSELSGGTPFRGPAKSCQKFRSRIARTRSARTDSTGAAVHRLSLGEPGSHLSHKLKIHRGVPTSCHTKVPAMNQMDMVSISNTDFRVARELEPALRRSSIRHRQSVNSS